MSDMKQSYLVTYDVTDDTRRNHVAKILQTSGERLQYSVFLLEVRPSKILRIRQQLELEMDVHDDSVIICPLGSTWAASRDMVFLGRQSYADIAIPTVI